MIIPSIPPTLERWPDAIHFLTGLSGGDDAMSWSRSDDTFHLYGNDLGEITKGWSSIIGIVTAIVGNVLISIALNTQRYAHVRQAQEREDEKEEREQQQHSSDEDGQRGKGPAGTDDGNGDNDDNYTTRTTDGTLNYGSIKTQAEDGSKTNGNPLEYHSTGTDSRQKSSSSSSTHTEGRTCNESKPLLSSSQHRSKRRPSSGKTEVNATSHRSTDTSKNDNDGSDNNSDNDKNSDNDSRSSNDTSEEPNEKNYLRSPYWWLGIVLMTIGEGGNFLAYGFAPASIVSPLGVVALISNCIIAPFMLREPFRKRDFFGVIVAIAGAVTVVLSANNSNPKLGPADIWHRIKTWEFETYLLVTLVIILILMVASNKYGEKSVLIDLSLAGLLGELKYTLHV